MALQRRPACRVHPVSVAVLASGERALFLVPEIFLDVALLCVERLGVVVVKSHTSGGRNAAYQARRY